MSIFQSEILSASDVCSNCLARQRREAAQPLQRATHADRDEDGYPVQDDDGHWVRRHTERCRWQTTVDDVPGPVVTDAGMLFCDCGADGPYTRFLDSRDLLDAERRKALILAAVDTLEAKGYRVDTRRFAEIVVDVLPAPNKLAPHRKDVINEAFGRAAELAAVDDADASPAHARP